MHLAFRGSLTVPTIVLAHAAIVRCLAEQPLAVVVDVGELVSRSNVAVPFFLTVRRRMRRPPPTPLFVVAGRTGNGSGLRSALTRYVTTCATLEEARELAARLPTAGRCRHVRLAPTPYSPHVARNLVAEACAAWRMTGLMHPARTVVSELVSNAVEHAGTDIEVSVTMRGSSFLCVAVRDGSAVLPRMRDQVPHEADAPLDIRGYGLRMLDNVAHSWGSQVTTDGKVVWAALQASEADRRSVW